MTQPIPYNPQTDFSIRDDMPDGDLFDNEFTRIKTTIDQILGNISLLQNDSGALANYVVNPYSLAPATITLLNAALNPTGEFVPGKVYYPRDSYTESVDTYITVNQHSAQTVAEALSAGNVMRITPGIPGEKGDAGEPGPDGVSVISASISVDGNLILELSDGNTIDAGQLPVADGGGGVVVGGGAINGVSEITSGITLTAAEDSYLISGKTTTGSINVVLPTATGNEGLTYFARLSGGSQPMFFTPQSGQTINAASNFSITSLGEWVMIVCTGTTWYAMPANSPDTVIDQPSASFPADVLTRNASFSVTAQDDNVLFVITATTEITAALPAASTMPDMSVTFLRTGNSTFRAQLNATTLAFLGFAGDWVTLVSDGSSWRTIGLQPMNTLINSSITAVSDRVTDLETKEAYVPRDITEYFTAGTYSFTPPDGVNRVMVKCLGGGGDSRPGDYVESTVVVTPGQPVALFVGAPGDNSSFGGTVLARGGNSNSASRGDAIYASESVQPDVGLPVKLQFPGAAPAGGSQYGCTQWVTYSPDGEGGQTETVHPAKGGFVVVEW